MWQKTKNIYHFFVAVLANAIFLFPARDIKVIAVTGTDGKTTTVNLIYHILKNAGHKTSMISSISAVINGKTYDTGFHVTTPSSFSLQKFLKRAKDANCEYFVLEATSHAIDQNRIGGIPIKVGVLTNITNEHLDYHKTYENYLKTKSKLLEKSEICIVNQDDKSYNFLLKTKDVNKKLRTYGLSKKSEYNPGVLEIKDCKLFGDFNKYNILAAAATARVLGIKDEEVIKALKSFQVPIGREDYVYKKDFSVMVDFAHTPNAFEQVLSALKPIVKGKIIHVFGSAGERDKLKRSEMGKVSSKYSDLIILTAEDPRGEDVNEIINQIAVGIDKKKPIRMIPDRKRAILEGIKIAEKGDLVLITGKAQESSMNYGHGEEPWDEFIAVEDALEERGKI